MDPESDTPTATRRVFAGFSYKEPYRTTYSVRLTEAVSRDGWQMVMPLDREPEGLLLDRVIAMIRSSERAVYDLGNDNANVWFELGVSLGRRQPVAITSERGAEELMDILRSPWLRTYTTVDECVEAVRGFLRLASPPPAVAGSLTAPAQSVAVVGSGSRAEAVAEALVQAGRSVARFTPATIGSFAHAVEIADTCGSIVAVRPAGEWPLEDCAPTLLALGSGLGLARNVVLAAAEKEWIPSDCIPLVVRDFTLDEDAHLVAEALDRPAPTPPPSGTMRPRISGAIERGQQIVISRALTESGSAALDAEPGYGKTTTLTQVADHLGGPTAWITVDLDWSMADLVERLVAAVGEHAPAFAWRALVALRQRPEGSRPARVAPSDRPPDANAIAQMIADDLEQVSATADVLLVVDDVHKATHEGARLIAQLISLSPSWLKIIVSGRGLPGEIGQLSRSSKLATYSAEALRFSEDDTRIYLRDGSRIADDDRTDLLFRQTEGWPAALAVIRVWLDTHPDATNEQIRDMARGDRRAVYRVFVQDYFVDLEPMIQGDLLLAALPIHLGGNVADWLYGPGGALRLRQVADGPYFVTEDGPGTFRMHSLFREFLLLRWEEERGQSSLLKRRSELATWYQEAGDAADAFEVACEGNVWDVAVAAIQPLIRGLANRGDAFLLSSILQRLPEDRIRQSRPLWESWVRALGQLGDPRALLEATALAASPGADTAEQALAEMLVVDLRYERSIISEEELASAYQAIADRLGADQPRLAVQARIRVLQARTVHNANPDDWPGFLQEAQEVVRAAKDAGMSGLAAVALALAGDLAGRIFQNDFSSDLGRLTVAASLGVVPPLAVRLAKVQPLVSIQRTSSALFKEAFQLAQDGDDELALAQVYLSFARFMAFQTMSFVLRDGGIDAEGRQFGEQAISLAMDAARTYERHGAIWNVVTCLNAAAEAASALDDRVRRDELSLRAEGVASKYGYRELLEAARRIRARPTAMQFRNECAQPEPFHQQGPERLQTFIDAIIEAADLSPGQQDQVRPILEGMLRHEVYLDSQREQVCRYLGFLQDLRGPKIGPFAAQAPRWGVICRMRGIETVSHHRNASALVRQFVAGVCVDCAFRSPAVGAEDYGHGDEEIYRPLLDRLAKEDGPAS